MANEEDNFQEERSEEGEDLSSKIIKAFQNHGFEVFRDKVVGSIDPDYFVVSPTGTTSVFEVKNWEVNPANIEWASNLASRFVSASGADNAFILMPKLKSSDIEAGLVTITDLDDVLVRETFMREPSKDTPRPRVIDRPERKVFAAMPFAPLYDDTYFVGLQPACLAVNADCIRVDYDAFTGDVVQHIKEIISASYALVADLSESRPNVLYEMGFAEGLGIPVVQICSCDPDELPFDVRNNRTIQYALGGTFQLRQRLEIELARFIKG
jgi:hypothetical protein